MDGDEDLKLSGPNVDLFKVPPLNHKRSVTFMNHFLLHTSNFINNFAAVSEEKLLAQSLEIQKLEISLKILEAKLDSIPGLENTTTTKPKEAPEPISSAPVQQAPSPADNQPESNNSPSANVITVKNDPRYARFLKMVNVGVPKVAIENKMRLEGLDPTLLDTPDAPVPDAVVPSSEENSNSDDSSSEDFSD